jgi:hypothetical protein
MRRVIGSALVAVLALAACGSSGGGGGGAASSDKGQQYVDAIMKNYDKNGAKSGFTRSQAKCIAAGMVDAAGVDTLQSVGTPDEVASGGNPFQELGKKLTPAQANEVVAVITDGRCFDFKQLVVKQAKGDNSGSFDKLTDPQIECFFGKLLDNKAFKQAMADSILGRDSSSSAFSKAFSDQSAVFKILSDCNIKPSQLGG